MRINWESGQVIKKPVVGLSRPEYIQIWTLQNYPNLANAVALPPTISAECVVLNAENWLVVAASGTISHSFAVIAIPSGIAQGNHLDHWPPACFK
jgi:hypothetical protein